MQTAGAETEAIRRSIFPILEKSELAGARMLSDPYRRVRGRMTEFAERMDISERGAAQQAGEQFATEREGFRSQERQRRGALMGELAGGAAEVGMAGLQRFMLGDLLGKGKMWDPAIRMGMAGVRIPYGYSQMMRGQEQLSEDDSDYWMKRYYDKRGGS